MLKALKNVIRKLNKSAINPELNELKNKQTK
jgi:hypothetical protein